MNELLDAIARMRVVYMRVSMAVPLYKGYGALCNAPRIGLEQIRGYSKFLSCPIGERSTLESSKNIR